MYAVTVTFPSAGRWNYEVNDHGDPLLYMESIPYWETRSYVAIVMKNYWMYERQAHAASQSRAALAANAKPMFPSADEGSGVSSRQATERQRQFKKQFESFVEREDVLQLRASRPHFREHGLIIVLPKAARVAVQNPEAYTSNQPSDCSM